MSAPERMWLPLKALDSDPELRLGDILWLDRAETTRGVWRQKMRVEVIHRHGYVLEKVET